MQFKNNGKQFIGPHEHIRASFANLLSFGRTRAQRRRSRLSLRTRLPVPKRRWLKRKRENSRKSCKIFKTQAIRPMTRKSATSFLKSEEFFYLKNKALLAKQQILCLKLEKVFRTLKSIFAAKFFEKAISIQNEGFFSFAAKSLCPQIRNEKSSRFCAEIFPFVVNFQ